jgi:hypothetical protein
MAWVYVPDELIERDGYDDGPPESCELASDLDYDAPDACVGCAADPFGFDDGPPPFHEFESDLY